MPIETSQLMEKLSALTKRRGFIFQSSELYGGINGAWDYGPLGVELKRNVKDAWWQAVVRDREDVVGLDSAILMHPMVWKASGHVSNFADPMVDCKKCKKRYRVDEIEPEYETTGKVPTECPDPKCKGELTRGAQVQLDVRDPRSGRSPTRRPRPISGRRRRRASSPTSRTWSTRRAIKVPFGIAQIGKSFRNEINPRNFTFRSREFEQMEIEFFCQPGSDDEWFEYWVEERKKWYAALGMNPEKLRFREHEKEKLSHYSKATTDVEYLFPFGWGELEGIANRTDFDLRAAPDRHALGRQVAAARSCRISSWSTEDAEYGRAASSATSTTRRSAATSRTSIEPSAGADRATLAFLCDAYDEDIAGTETRVVLQAASAAGADQGGGAAAREEGRDARARAARSTTSLKKRWRGRSTTSRRRSESATGGRTRRARRCASPSTAIRSRPAR